MRYRYRRQRERGHVPNVDGKPHRGDGHTDRTVVYGLLDQESSERCTVIVYGRNGSISGSYTEYRLDGIAGRRADRYDIYRNQ